MRRPRGAEGDPARAAQTIAAALHLHIHRLRQRSCLQRRRRPRVSVLFPVREVAATNRLALDVDLGHRLLVGVEVQGVLAQLYHQLAGGLLRRGAIGGGERPADELVLRP